LITTTPLPENAITVSFLIDESTSLWNADVIQSIFTEETASKILQVPLSRYGGDDFASWPHAKFGIYTVRSAYNLARSESFFATQSSSGRGLSSAVCKEERLWKKLWNVKAPGKMKITLWRLAHDCLPSGHQLCRRNIPASDVCVFCGREERAEHTVIFCQYAMEVWRAVECDFTVKLCRNEFTTSKAWLFEFLDRSSDQETVTLAVTCWHL
jgi:hypothetical protein